MVVGIAYLMEIQYLYKHQTTFFYHHDEKYTHSCSRFSIALLQPDLLRPGNRTRQTRSISRLLGDKNKFMGSVSVFSKGTEIYARSVGFADIDKQIVADAQSEYHIGSISKLFTTVMIISSHRSRTAFLILTDRFVFSYH